MTTYQEVDGLRAARLLADGVISDTRAATDSRSAWTARPEGPAGPVRPAVLSLYLRIPADPADLRELPARAHDLVALAAGRDAGARRSGAAVPAAAAAAGIAAAEQRARRIAEAHGRDWLGHTGAIFTAAGDGDGWHEAFSLPCELPDRAIIAARPHIRPLLVALQRCPAYYVVVVDARHAWLLRITGDRIEQAGSSEEEAQVRSRGFGGWYGLESHRINDRVIELQRDHFRASAALVERAARPGGDEPIVIGGHADTVPAFAATLPAALRERVAGTFRVDPHTMTPAMVRDLADPVIAAWTARRETALAGELAEAEQRKDPLLVTGLRRCLDAVNQRAVRLLAVPAGGIVGGYACARCGALSSDGAGCDDGREQAVPVPDLFEEMVTRTIDEGGKVESLADPTGDVAAQLRFGVVESNGR